MCGLFLVFVETVRYLYVMNFSIILLMKQEHASKTHRPHHVRVTDDPLDVTPYSNNPQNHPFHLTPK
jgi:hypothetical protein